MTPPMNIPSNTQGAVYKVLYDLYGIEVACQWVMLRAWRKSGLTMNDAARRIGRYQKTLWRWLGDADAFGMRDMAEMACALDCRISFNIEPRS